MGKEFKCEKCNGNGYFTLERFKTIKFGDERIMSKKSEERLKSTFQPNNATQDMKSPETGKINKLMESTLVFQGVEENNKKEEPIPVGRGISQKNPLSRENLNQILNNNNNIVTNPYNNANNLQNALNKQQTLGYSYNNPEYPQFTQIKANNVNNQQPNYHPNLVRKNVIMEGGYQMGGFNNNNLNMNNNNQPNILNQNGENKFPNQMYQQQNSANFTQHPFQQQQMFYGYQQQNSLPQTNFSRPPNFDMIGRGPPPNFRGVQFFYGQGGNNNQNNLHRIDTSSFLRKKDVAPEFSKIKPLEMPSGYKKNY